MQLMQPNTTGCVLSVIDTTIDCDRLRQLHNQLGELMDRRGFLSLSGFGSARDHAEWLRILTDFGQRLSFLLGWRQKERALTKQGERIVSREP